MWSINRGYLLLTIAAISCSGPDTQVIADAGDDDDADVLVVDAPDGEETLASMCGAVPTTVDEWEACYTKRYCETLVYCGEQNLFTDVQECIDHLDATQSGKLSFERFEKKRAVAAGRASIDPVAFEQCLHAWSTQL